jgi:hypothetical protein
VTTLASVVAGKSTASGEPGKQTWKDLIAKVGPYVFIAGLVCWISWCIYKIGGNYIAGHRIFDAILICAVVALVMSLRVDVNQFSMHLFYRNRLVRCYLGASNKKRFPNQFTGFDPDDDMALKDLSQKNGYDGPYPVINASLNLVKGKDLAWQERKAESFVMTPQFCGYDVWLEEQDSPLLMKERREDQRLDKRTPAGMAGNTPATQAMTGDSDIDISATTVRQRQGLDRYGYRPTALYAFPSPLDGPRLGLAMGISGAAASPNMGFYSSPPVAFLMTLFDVRLGQWLGNPRNPKTWQRATPRFGLTYLLNELFAGTNDDAAYIYLSDGGHFENMALYELVKRRCGLIIVCDAEADDCYGFSGLGNAIRKCRIDMGIDIALDLTEITPPKVGEPSAKHCAIGTIHYETVDVNAPSGTIIYFKASLTGDEPSDIRNYHTIHGQFPHESTIDQWFSESQFESYRVLGYHEVMTSVKPWGAVGTPAAIPGASGAETQTTAAQSDSTPVAANWKTVAASVVQAAAAAVAHAAAKLSSPRIEVTEGEQTLETKEGLKPLQERVSDALNRFGFDTAKLSSNETSDSR